MSTQKISKIAIVTILTVMLGVLITSCGGDPPTPEVIANMSLSSGDSQTAQFGTALADLVEVEVKDQDGNGFAGVKVIFAVTEGGGSVSPTEATTDSLGKASTAWTLGPTEGTQTLTVTAFKADGTTPLGSPLTFTATALADPPVATSIVITQGNDQTAQVGTALADPVEVIVTDQYSNPFAGVKVIFAVAEGGGSVSPTEATTSSLGIASTIWTLGLTVGEQTLTATALKADGTTPIDTPVTFTATAISEELVATSIVINRGNNQTAQVGTALGNSIFVRVIDQYGNGFAGVNVSFTGAEGGGSFSPPEATTNFDGFAGTTWTLGPTAGTQTLTVTAFKADGTTPLENSPITFTATGVK